jgi:hypothetical protein
MTRGRLLLAMAVSLTASPAQADDYPLQVKDNTQAQGFYNRCGQFWPNELTFERCSWAMACA